MNWLWNSLFQSNEPRNVWFSFLIIFKDENVTVLDKGFIFLGEIPIDAFAYYCNFTNFSKIDNNLYYFYKNGTAKQIDPSKVFLHIKFGQSSFDLSAEIFRDKDYSNLFFSSKISSICESIIKYLSKKNTNINILDFSNIKVSSKRRAKPENIKHPFFRKKEIYGTNLDQIILSDLDISFF